MHNNVYFYTEYLHERSHGGIFMSEKNDEKQKELDRREQENKEIKETGEVTLDQNRKNHKIELLTIIGEVEGHDAAPSQSKTTKY